MANHTRPKTSKKLPQAITVVIHGGFALVNPAVADLLPFLQYDQVEFAAGGPHGYSPSRKTHMLYDTDHLNRLVIPTGLVRRVREEATALGYEVVVTDRRQFSSAHVHDPEYLEDLWITQRSAADAMIQEPIGQIHMANEMEVINGIELIYQLFSQAKIVIAVFDHQEGLIYCDQPYVHDTRSDPNAYKYEMTDQEHRDLAVLLHRCKAKIVVSGYPSALYDEIFGDWRRVDFDIANHAAGGKTKSRATECIWMNY